jgi:hypothetical protein
MEEASQLSDNYHHSQIDLNDFCQRAESMLFIGQLMKDISEMLSNERMSLDDELFLAIQEMSVEVLDLAEHLLVVFNSAYLDDEVKDNIDLSGLRIWIHGFAHFSESFSQEQRIISFKQIITKMVKNQGINFSRDNREGSASLN